MLNIGDGTKGVRNVECPYQSGEYITIDSEPTREPTVLHDVTKGLPFPSNHFDIVFTSHLLEHLTGLENLRLVGEIRRVLKPNGTLEIYVPDLAYIGRKLWEVEDELSRVNEENNRVSRDWLIRFIYGAQFNKWEFHKWGYTLSYLKEFIESKGFNVIVAEHRHETSTPSIRIKAKKR